MRKFAIVSLILMSLNVGAQERLFSIGYAKNYVSKDSTNFALTIDLNRIPGPAEKAGGIYFFNETFKNSNLGWYAKPSVDVNIGSGVSVAPNNISVALPFGLVYDLAKPKVMSLYLEAAPEFVSDKSMDNFLRYFSIGPYFKYEYNKAILINLSGGITWSSGRRAYSAEGKTTNSYAKWLVPIYFRFNAWNAVNKSDKKPYKRISWINSFKYNNVYRDDRTITPDETLFFYSSKFDFYFVPRIGINLTYNNGFEEPLFKKVHSLSFGLTFTRF